MSNWWRSILTRSVVLIGVTLVAAVGGQVAMPRAPKPATTVVVPISSLALSCPALPADTVGLDATVKAALLDGNGSATLDVQSRKPQHATVKPNAVASIAVARTAPAEAAASGPAASQLVADASIVGTSSSSKGYAAYTCQPPSASQWLVGGASVAGRTSVLFIANVDDTDATVDVEVWSENGKSTARSLQGIDIRPRSVKQLPLSLVDPGRKGFVVHVLATSGQVTSEIVDQGQKALASLGVDAVSPVAQPLASSDVGVLPEGMTGATLALLSPDLPTAVRVSLVTSDGTYPLAGAENLALDADKVTLVSIPDAALVGDAAVQVQADEPVIAGVQGFMSVKGGSDLASAVMMAPIYRLASTTVDSGVTRAYALLFSDLDTTVVVQDIVGAKRTSTSVHVKSGVITRVPVVAAAGTVHLLSVEPAVDGTVSGSVLLQRPASGSTGTSIVPLTSVRGYVAVPPISPDTTR